MFSLNLAISDGRVACDMRTLLVYDNRLERAKQLFRQELGRMNRKINELRGLELKGKKEQERKEIKKRINEEQREKECVRRVLKSSSDMLNEVCQNEKQKTKV